MATVTSVVAVVADSDGTRVRLELDHSDVVIGDDDHALVAVRCVNGLSRPVTVVFQRPNGSTWFTATIPAGETRTQNAGGPVSRVSHLPTFSLRT